MPVLICNISCKFRNASEWLYQLWAAAVRHCATVKSQSSVLHPLDTHVPIIPAWQTPPWCCKVWSSWSILSNHESASDWDWDLKTSADQISWCRPGQGRAGSGRGPWLFIGRGARRWPGLDSANYNNPCILWPLLTSYPHLTHWHWSRDHGTPAGNELE